MNGGRRKRTPLNTTDNDLSKILGNFKKYEELDRSLSKINKIRKGLKNALYSDKSFVLKINNRQSSADEVGKLATVLAKEDEGEKITCVWDKSLFGIIGNHGADGNYRTSVILSNVVIGLSENPTDVSLSLGKRLFNEMDEIVEANHGKIIIDESSLSFGKIFLTTKKPDPDDTIFSVLHRIVKKSNPWKKVMIKTSVSNLQGMIKTNGSDSIIIIPAEEMVRYAKEVLSSEFHYYIGQIRVSKITKKMSEKLAELFRPYEYIIRASNVKVGKKDMKKINFPLDSFIASRSLILSDYAWIKSSQKKDLYDITMHSSYYRIFLTSDHKSIVMLPGELLVTGREIKEIDLDNALKEVDTEIFEKLGNGEAVGTSDIGRLYYIPTHGKKLRTRGLWEEREFQLKTFNMTITMYRNGGYFLILPSEIKKILEKEVGRITKKVDSVDF